MNILLAYSKVKGTTAEYCERSLRKKHNIEVFDFKNTVNWGVKLGKRIPKGIPPFVSTAISRCKIKPDLIIVIDSEGAHHFVGMRRCKIPSAFWAIDTPRPKRPFYKAIARDFDYFFVAVKDDVRTFREITRKGTVYFLPLACDPSIHKDYSLKRIYDICFVGSLDPRRHLDRVKLLNRIKQRFRVHISENVWGEEMAKIFSQSKIIFNKNVLGGLNMRTFEAMACGGLLLTDEEDSGINELFEDKKHLVLYKEHNLEELIEYYLNNDKEREKIAKAGQREVLEKHTYDIRMDTMLLPLQSK